LRHELNDEWEPLEGCKQQRRAKRNNCASQQTVAAGLSTARNTSLNTMPCSNMNKHDDGGVHKGSPKSSTYLVGVIPQPLQVAAPPVATPRAHSASCGGQLQTCWITVRASKQWLLILHRGRPAHKPPTKTYAHTQPPVWLKTSTIELDPHHTTLHSDGHRRLTGLNGLDGGGDVVGDGAVLVHSLRQRPWTTRGWALTEVITCKQCKQAVTGHDHRSKLQPGA
jgi:hypothetical protein